MRFHEHTARKLSAATVKEHYSGEQYRQFNAMGTTLFAVYDPRPRCGLFMRAARWAVYQGEYHCVRAAEPITYFNALDIAALDEAGVVE